MKRSYTIDEIDAMRAFFASRIPAPFVISDCWRSDSLREYEQDAKDQAERELRTAMMAGVDPKECSIEKGGDA